MAGAPSERQKMVAEALWKTLVYAYQDPGDRAEAGVAIPPREAAGAILTCLSNVIAQIPDAKERNALLRMIGPATAHSVDRARLAVAGSGGRMGLIMPGSGIELPH